MPISPRLSGKLYSRIRNLVSSASDFLFFGTYGLSIRGGILNQIINQKQNNSSLLVACLLPPPTDFILWDFSVRSHLLRAYNLTGSNNVDLARAIAENPLPAYAVLQNLWKQSRAAASQQRIISHIRKIGQLYSNGIVVALEPNTHAKFVASESNIYEGSGNLTRYGLTVNVEVYNFYPRTYPRVYEYAARSYSDFLQSYLANFISWKLGSSYLNNANQLGTQVEQIANTFGIRFNPKVTRDKINAIADAREKLTVARSELWQLKGHKLLLNLDFSLMMANLQIQTVLGRLWSKIDEEIETDLVKNLEIDLEKIRKATNGVAKNLKDLQSDRKEHLSWYEMEHLDKVINEAKRYQEYLRKRGEKFQ